MAPRGNKSQGTDGEVVVAMSVGKVCKNSVKFVSEDPSLTNIYLGNDALDELGKPESIVVAISAG